ncbi:hypothetical protein CHO01_24980 [Cellulomonas hominis]|nr:hypothetical protein CHO01_24980 [Cellulomonas hominis]
MHRAAERAVVGGHCADASQVVPRRELLDGLGDRRRQRGELARDPGLEPSEVLLTVREDPSVLKQRAKVLDVQSGLVGVQPLVAKGHSSRGQACEQCLHLRRPFPGADALGPSCGAERLGDPAHGRWVRRVADDQLVELLA